MSTFPESLYRLLALIDSHPSRQVRYEEIPEDLINALQIGRHHKLIDSSSDDPDILFRTAHVGNPIYDLTSAGRCELAMYRERSDQPVPDMDNSSKATGADPLRLVELTGDLIQRQVLEIAGNGQPVNDRLYAILRKDRRYAGKTSAELAEILKVTDGAIRRTDAWKLRDKIAERGQLRASYVTQRIRSFSRRFPSGNRRFFVSRLRNSLRGLLRPPLGVNGP